MLCLAGSQSELFSISETLVNKDSLIHLAEERHSEIVVEFCNYTGSGIDAVNLGFFSLKVNDLIRIKALEISLS